MRALPDDVTHAKTDQLTGVTCVDCPGVVQIRKEGKSGYLRFECRIGHVFSEAELLEGKERRIEEWLRSALLGVEELIALLCDLESYEAHHALRHPGYEKRRAVLEAQARALRELCGMNEPVDLRAGARNASVAAPAAGGAPREGE